MKKIPTAITLAVFLAYPTFSFADYVIHLKDGTWFVTDRYFEEGDQIKFKRYGGFIGIKKDRIREIEETEIPSGPEEESSSSPQRATIIPKAGVEGQKEREGDPSIAEGPATEGQPGNKERQAQPLAEKEKELIDAYLKKFDLYREKFKSVELMTKEELIGFSKELDTFKKEVLSRRLGAVLSDHLLEGYAMLDRIEAILKFKGD